MHTKYIFFDIDGTLTYNDPAAGRPVLPDSTRQTLDALRANGHFVSIATGRAHWMTRQVAEETGITDLVTDGGNGIVLHNELIELRPLNPDQLTPLIAQLQKDGIPFGVSLSDDNRLTFASRHSADCISEFSSFMRYMIDDTIDYTQAPVLKIFIRLSPQEEAGYPILSTLPHMRYRPETLLIEPTDKYAGITRLMRYMKAPMEDVVVFGDGWNDLDMIRRAPFGIAMGNAVDALRAEADYVTGSVREDGVRQACMHFGWI